MAKSSIPMMIGVSLISFSLSLLMCILCYTLCPAMDIGTQICKWGREVCIRAYEVSLGDIVLFRDDRCSRPIDETGCNQWAFVVDSDKALFCRRRVHTLPLHEIPSLPEVRLVGNPHPSLGHKFANFFLAHREYPAHFNAGAKALLHNNHQPFLEGRLFPIPPKYESNRAYEAAWSQLLAKLQPLDCVFLVDRKSLLSRFIAWATHGPWSHVAMHLKNGEVIESTTSGLRRVAIDSYQNRNYWVATYRPIEWVDGPPSSESIDGIANNPFDGWTDGYNYRGAIYYGCKALLGDHEHNLTPNSMIYSGRFVRISQA